MNNDAYLNSRRKFVKQTATLAGAMMAAPLLSNANFFSGSDDAIKIVLIGCGGRGTGAAMQALMSKQNVQLVAMADAFRDNLDRCLNNLIKTAESSGNKAIKDRITVPEERKFTGFDAYLKAIPLADVVILATPPGFRPIHFDEAIKQNKHVFMEKPVATDPAGVQKVLATAAIAKQKKLNVVVGLQRRYQNSYRELFKRKDEIGDIVSMQAWWNNDGVWVRPRKPEQTEMEYQMRNWYYFVWLCGDHITEQHIHNLDVINWFKEGYPVKAQGMGGRQVRKGKDNGEIFDHHYVEFEYADGSLLNSQCRHIPGTMSRVDELLVGAKGRIRCGAGRITDAKGNTIYQFDRKTENNPYQTEHDELFAAIAKGEYKFADAENGAKSSMTSILGRMATYSGQVIEWDKALNSGLDLHPKVYDFAATPPVLPNADGFYPVAIPGVTKYS
ncbi:Tat (twin-arginine translocation) pathway signal sequence [Hydrobacter penzbergensis]|uniref:Tat (Twin-arginine translocation) pathway signal sequence n=1 Tax=Hydrobacter penzbergensis TaxID=1235997 RepID=A0A8X8ICG4_9BACT|nr:Gfo/Idh/MocA family oxidoreductase [Hydrobacter penzbergensis]SDW91850.1 Tat (twin-arginine translocation) pathway signal sequence [Hydrobacter penzbergensis]